MGQIPSWLPPGQSRWHTHRRNGNYRGDYYWTTRDYLLQRDVGRFNTEAGANRRRDRLNADWERFKTASTSDHYVGYVAARRSAAR